MFLSVFSHAIKNHSGALVDPVAADALMSGFQDNGIDRAGMAQRFFDAPFSALTGKAALRFIVSSQRLSMGCSRVHSI